MNLSGVCAIVGTLTLSGFSANAQIGGPSNDTFKAGLLHSACNPPPATDQSTRDLALQTCEMYFRGLTDGLFLMKTFQDGGNAGCLPTNAPISDTEGRGDFELFLRDHPEAAKNSAGLVAVFGIMRAHPCAKAN